ncbi:hypothetical protein, partial [Klebsiella pneumoniae]|uniref:hypothetical protein n=1 Tax=Klebsiella pneumoniae TaxID=573 RepID=UPI003852762D
AILSRLGISKRDLLRWSVFRRGYDARKPAAISLIYTIDFDARDEAALLKKRDRNINPAPDTAYKFVAHAPAGLEDRPVV